MLQRLAWRLQCTHDAQITEVISKICAHMFKIVFIHAPTLCTRGLAWPWSKNGTHKPRDVDSFGPVYAGIYWFAIPARATRGSWILTYLSMHERMHRHCVSVSLLSIMLWVAGGNCVPRRVIVKRIRCDRHRGEPTDDLYLTLPYLTLPYLTLPYLTLP